ncbi:winged helix-turn-helix transcriptional regulator [Nocardia sp. NPDC046473]|uniref:winged helix-turn-helix transcriptional regulator n=1 Tax=Nocardia sp. NPDC046473 TaxID=3155733 RepID=UPI0033C472E8
MTDRSDELETLRVLVNHRHVVEILDALSHGPRRTAELMSTIAGRRRALARALRVIAAHGLVAADRRGSWDQPPSPTVRFWLTERGLRAVESLSNLTIWTALYEQNDHVTDRRHR